MREKDNTNRLVASSFAPDRCRDGEGLISSFFRLWPPPVSSPSMFPSRASKVKGLSASGSLASGAFAPSSSHSASSSSSIISKGTKIDASAIAKRSVAWMQRVLKDQPAPSSDDNSLSSSKRITHSSASSSSSSSSASAVADAYGLHNLGDKSDSADGFVFYPRAFFRGSVVRSR